MATRTKAVAKEPETLQFNVNDLDMGAFEDFEEHTGLNLATVAERWQQGDLEGMSMKTLTAFLWILKRQSEPGFTLDDARRIKIVDLPTLLPS